VERFTRRRAVLAGGGAFAILPRVRRGGYLGQGLLG
jgi:hypothetical protein